MLIHATAIRAETTNAIVDIINFFAFIIILPQKFQYKNDDTPANDIIHHTSITAVVIDLNNVGLKQDILSLVFLKKTDEINANATNKIGANFII